MALLFFPSQSNLTGSGGLAGSGRGSSNPTGGKLQGSRSSLTPMNHTAIDAPKVREEQVQSIGAAGGSRETRALSCRTTPPDRLMS